MAAQACASSTRRRPKSGNPKSLIDVVHICTPNHTHVPLAIAALEAGKNIVVEKPLFHRRLPGHEEQPEAASRYSGPVHPFRFGVTMSRAAPAKTWVASARGLPPLVAALSGL